VSDIVTIGLIQAHHDTAGGEPVEVHKRVAIEKHVRMIREAAKRGAKIVCLQELFYGPYFCTEQDPKWYEATELVPDGPTTRLMQDLARELGIALVVPLYERTISGVYYNTAVIIDADGSVLGIYRKHHIPQVAAGPAGCGFWE
jgi:beta-ureidopropionase